MSSEAKRTLVVFYPGCIEFEVMLAAELLNEKLPIDVITPDGSDHEGSNGMRIHAASAYNAVNTERYRVVLVPGGDVESVFENETLFSLLRRVYDAGAFVGAICAGPILLGKAGLLTGRTFTHGMGDLYPEVLRPIWQVGTFCNGKRYLAAIRKDYLAAARGDDRRRSALRSRSPSVILYS